MKSPNLVSVDIAVKSRIDDWPFVLAVVFHDSLVKSDTELLESVVDLADGVIREFDLRSVDEKDSLGVTAS